MQIVTEEKGQVIAFDAIPEGGVLIRNGRPAMKLKTDEGLNCVYLDNGQLFSTPDEHEVRYRPGAVLGVK